MAAYSAREAWLARAIDMFRPRFREIGYELPKIRISVGFGPTGAKQENNVILGVTVNPFYVSDGVYEVWISPVDADTASMLATLIHELIHCVCFDDGHGSVFGEAAVRLGLEGPMTATRPSLALTLDLITMADALGPYPGGTIDMSKIPVAPDGTPVPLPPSSSAGPKQTTRMLKVTCVESECPASGFSVRLSRKWLAIGAPMCPFGHPMF